MMMMMMMVVMKEGNVQGNSGAAIMQRNSRDVAHEQAGAWHMSPDESDEKDNRDASWDIVAK